MIAQGKERARSFSWERTAREMLVFYEAVMRGSMKIVLDGYELGKTAKGVGRVIGNLLVPLPAFLPEDEFLIFTKEAGGRLPAPGVEDHVLPGRGGYLRWQNGPLRRALKEAEPDLLIASNYVLPLSCPWKSVLFAHDISVIAHPEWYPQKIRLDPPVPRPEEPPKGRSVIVSSAFVEGGSPEVLRNRPDEKIKTHRLWGRGQVPSGPRRTR